MNRPFSDPKLPEVESLFAIERELVPQSNAVRERVLQRVCASLPRSSWELAASQMSRRRRLRVGGVAAAAVLLSALCAAAFYAGYQSRNLGLVEPASTLAVAMPPVALPVPAVPSVSLLVANLEPTVPVPFQSKPRVAAPANSVTENEGFAAELRLLQPAQQAVSRRDFASALASIAEHQRQFPSGRLSEEREALRVKALLGLGRTVEAQRAGAAFRARFPRSALLGRIDEMLGKQK
jgi:hypothetical protein